MRVLHVPNTFHRDDMFPIDANQGRETGVDRRVVDLLRRGVNMGEHLSDTSYQISVGELISTNKQQGKTYHRTRATSPFRTAQLRPRQPHPSQVLQQRQLRVDRIHSDLGAVQVEPDGIVPVFGQLRQRS